MITLFTVIVVVTVMVIFSLQNAAPVAVAFLSWKFEASVAIIILLAALIGILIEVASASFWRLKRSRARRPMRRDRLMMSHRPDPFHYMDTVNREAPWILP
jgi:uncharacterized integral membrane protein